MNGKMNFAIACMSGGYRSIFTQSVLKLFEERGVRADAYGACSSSVFLTPFAAAGRMEKLDPDIWMKADAIGKKEGNTQSNAVLEILEEFRPFIMENLRKKDTPAMLIAASRVITEEGAQITQTEKAGRLGIKLLMDSVRHNPQWKDENLRLEIFATFASSSRETPYGRLSPLTPDNFMEAAYASTRMLHQWHIPALVNGKPYIDGSYTCLCPAIPLAEAGYKHILCILTEHRKKFRDLFTEEEIPSRYLNSRISFLAPDKDLKTLGADYYHLTSDGVRAAWEHGREIASQFLANHSLSAD